MAVASPSNLTCVSLTPTFVSRGHQSRPGALPWSGLVRVVMALQQHNDTVRPTIYICTALYTAALEPNENFHCCLYSQISKHEELTARSLHKSLQP